jgi:hypothetical protein
VTVKLFEQTAELMACFDLPDKTLEAVGRVQDKLLKLIPIDPRGRIMFDYEQVQPRACEHPARVCSIIFHCCCKEDTRDELELVDDEEKDDEANKSEHGVRAGIFLLLQTDDAL